jgi:hypothetical protein
VGFSTGWRENFVSRTSNVDQSLQSKIREFLMIPERNPGAGNNEKINLSALIFALLKTRVIYRLHC